MAKRVAVLLSGCGVFDGSEIHEAVLTLLALDNHGAEAVCCAPDIDQRDVINHATGQPMPETRHVLVEAARIARGKIENISKITPAVVDALIIPGGYGAAKNLCSYAVDGPRAKVHPEVARVIYDFVQARKPIAAICIAPVVVAAVFRDTKDIIPTLTIGNDQKTILDLNTMGADHVECSARDIIVDRKNKIVTTPAYMLAKGPAELYVGIEKAVKEILELCEVN
ncbi:MAG: isoprenoid biosynthesis glyoxalase ElbB [Candidatus Sumerlaeaceae bacterium]